MRGGKSRAGTGIEHEATERTEENRGLAQIGANGPRKLTTDGHGFARMGTGPLITERHERRQESGRIGFRGVNGCMQIPLGGLGSRRRSSTWELPPGVFNSARFRISERRKGPETAGRFRRAGAFRGERGVF